MRHFLFSTPIPLHPFGVLEAAWSAGLIATTGFFHGAATHIASAVVAAIDMPSVAAATDERLLSAMRAAEESAGRFDWRSKSRQRNIDKGLPFVKYSRFTLVWQGVGHDIGGTWRF